MANKENNIHRTHSTTNEEIPGLEPKAPEVLHNRKAYRERAHVLACIGGLEVGAHENESCVTGVEKIEIAVLRDTRNGLPMGAVVRQITGELGTMEVWKPLFLERTRGKTLGQAEAYRQYWKSLHDPAFVASELLALYGRQTEDEQVAKDTKHLNERGFCAFSGRLGSRLAINVLNGKVLSGDDLCKATSICLRHRRQVLTGQ